MQIENELAGKTAFVMGGSSGIGLQSAIQLAQSGAAVTIVGHEQNTVSIAAELAATDLKVHGIMADGSVSSQVSAAIETTVDRFGGLDIIVCTAAIHPVGDIIETDEETWDRTFSVNMKSIYLSCHFGVPHLIKAKGGSIINFSSIQAHANTPRVCAYASTKGAIISFTNSLAIDLAKHNIRANTVLPGPIITPMQEHFARVNSNGRKVEDVYRDFAKPVPLKRLGQSSEVAEMVSFLAGPRASFCTGSQFTVDGGLHTSLGLF